MTGVVAGVAAVAGVAFGWWGVALVMLALGLLAVTDRTRVTAATCAIVLTAALLGAWRGEGARHVAVAGAIPTDWNRVVVVSAPERTNEYQLFVGESDPDENPPGGAATIRVCVVAPLLPHVGPGDTLQLSGEMQEERDASDAARRFLRSRHCQASVFAQAITITGTGSGPGKAVYELRMSISDVLRRAAPGDAGVLLAGLVTGDDAGFSEERAEAFIRTGTTHLTAVSGSNLALVAGMLATAGALTVGRHRLAWQLVTLAGIWSYAVISGAQAPVVRAALVASAAVLAFRVGRRPDFVTLILLAAGIMVIVDPDQVEGLGFRLSVAASLALAVVVPPLLVDQRASPLAAMLMAMTAAQMATLPLLLPVFGTISLTSLPVNIAVAPLVAIATPFAALAGVTGVIWPPLAELLVTPAVLAATVLLEIVDRLGAAPASVAVGVPAAMVAVVIGVAAALVLSIVSRSPRKGVW
jgi:ComEC/Rec2-related protein